MGCGASTDRGCDREDVYRSNDVKLAAARQVASDGDLMKPFVKSPESAKSLGPDGVNGTSLQSKGSADTRHTTTRLCSRLRKGLKYCELLESVTADTDEKQPERLAKLFEIIHGKRSIVTMPPVRPGPHDQVKIFTDFGVVGVSVDREQSLHIENATQAEVLNLVTDMSRDARCRRISCRFVKGHAKPVKVVSLAPNDWLLVTTDTALGPSEARVLDAQRDEQCGTLDGRRRDCFDSAYDASFTIDGTALASVHRMEKLFLWDMNTFRVKRTTAFTEENGEIRMSLVQFSPNAKLIAVGAEAAYEDADTVGILLIYDSQCKLVARYTCDEHCITALGFSNDSNFVICGYQDGGVSIVNVRSVEVVQQIQAHVSSVRGLSFTPCGRRFMTTDEREVCMWDASNCQKIWSRVTETPPPPPQPLRAPAPLSSAGSDGTPGPSPSSSTPSSVRGSTLPPVASATAPPPASVMPQRLLRNTCAICAPGALIMVARSDKTVSFLEQSTGADHSIITTKGVVMRMDAGCKSAAMGDVYGNVYMVDILQ